MTSNDLLRVRWKGSVPWEVASGRPARRRGVGAGAGRPETSRRRRLRLASPSGHFSIGGNDSSGVTCQKSGS